MEYVHGSRVRDDGRLVVELQDGLASHVHYQGVDARNVVRHARVGGLQKGSRANKVRRQYKTTDASNYSTERGGRGT